MSEESEHTEQAVMEIMRKEFGNRMGPVRNVLILAFVLGIAAAIALTHLLSWCGPY